MMKDPQQTIGNMADKYSTALISYIDEEGYPVTKAMLKPRERRGIKEFWFIHQYFFQQSQMLSEESKGKYLFCR